MADASLSSEGLVGLTSACAVAQACGHPLGIQDQFIFIGGTIFSMFEIDVEITVQL